MAKESLKIAISNNEELENEIFTVNKQDKHAKLIELLLEQLGKKEYDITVSHETKYARTTSMKETSKYTRTTRVSSKALEYLKTKETISYAQFQKDMNYTNITMNQQLGCLRSQGYITYDKGFTNIQKVKRENNEIKEEAIKQKEENNKNDNAVKENNNSNDNAVKENANSNNNVKVENANNNNNVIAENDNNESIDLNNLSKEEIIKRLQRERSLKKDSRFQHATQSGTLKLNYQ